MPSSWSMIDRLEAELRSLFESSRLSGIISAFEEDPN